MSDEEAYILADYLLCGVHAIAAIVALAQSIDSLL